MNKVSLLLTKGGYMARWEEFDDILQVRIFSSLASRPLPDRSERSGKGVWLARLDSPDTPGSGTFALTGKGQKLEPFPQK